MLVEDYLVTVISLQARVFNAYSGVKTWILILDRKLAKQTSLTSRSTKSRTTVSIWGRRDARSRRTICRW